MHKFFAWIGEFSVRFRWVIVPLWLAGTFLAFIFGPSITTDSDNSNFLPDSAASKHAIQLSTDSGLQKKNSFSVPIIVSRDGGMKASDDQIVAALQANLQKVAHVASAPSISGASPVLANGSHAAEQLTVQIAGIVQGPNSEADFKTLIDGLRQQIKATPHDSGFQIHVVGSIADQIDNAAKSGNNNQLVESFSVLVILLILLLIFRSFMAALLTLLPAGLVALLAQPVVGEVAQHGLKVSALATILMSVLVLGAGTDYGLFLIFRVREEFDEGRPVKEAVARSVARVGESIAFSAGTVIAALLSLLAATFGMYNTLGIPLAIGIGLMLLAGLTLQPALLAIFGSLGIGRRRLVELGIPLAIIGTIPIWWFTRDLYARRRTVIKPAKVGLWGKISGAVVQKPVPVLAVGILLFGTLATFTFGFKPSGFGDGSSAPAGTDSAAGEAIQAKYFKGQSGDQTQLIFKLAKPVWDDPSVLASAEKALSQQAVFVPGSVHGPLDVTGTVLSDQAYVQLHAKDVSVQQVAGQVGAGAFVKPVMARGADKADLIAYEASKRLISPDGRTVFFAVSLTAGDATSSAALHATPQIRSAVTDVAHQIGAVDSGVLGQSTVTYDISSISTHDLQVVIPIAIVIIGLLLMIVMRSVIAPLYLIVSVGLSYLAALGTAVLVFITIGGAGGLVFFLPFMMFIFLLALGEDYNILVMTRIREEAHHKPLKEAVRDALNATGTTVTSAGLVLAATFGVFAVVGGSGGGSQIRDLGVGMVVGILMDTFLVRTLLVPSTVILLGKWNWWPSKFSHDHQVESNGVEQPTSIG